MPESVMQILRAALIIFALLMVVIGMRHIVDDVCILRAGTLNDNAKARRTLQKVLIVGDAALVAVWAYVFWSSASLIFTGK